MGKKFEERYIQMKVAGDELINIDGDLLPYMVNRFGTIYGHGPSGVIIIQPYQDSKSGHLMVTLHSGQTRYTKRLNEIVAEAYVDNPESLQEVNHIDGDKLNCSSMNLEWIDPDTETEADTNSEVNGEPCRNKTKKKASKQIDDIAVCVCYRLFIQKKSNEEVKKEFGIPIQEIKEIGRYNEEKFNLLYQPQDTKKFHHKSKLKLLRPLIKNLIGRSLADYAVAFSINMADVDFDTVERHVRYIREKKMDS